MLLKICLCLAICIPATALSAAPGTGIAEVRMNSGGLPCFTIAEQEERRSGAPAFQAIRVVDAASKPPATVWAMTMPAGRSFPLMFSMCVPYGGRVASLPQESAELLEAGKPYEVVIELRPDATRELPRSLAARFCLLPGVEQATVKLLGAGMRCGPKLAPAPRHAKRQRN